MVEFIKKSLTEIANNEHILIPGIIIGYNVNKHEFKECFELFVGGKMSKDVKNEFIVNFDLNDKKFSVKFVKN